MTGRAFFALLFLLVLAARLTHSGIIWVEEAYPAAAAIQMLDGKVPYRDFVFDKPPLTPLLYLLWGARDGWPLRLAGAIFVTLVAWLLHGTALRLWGETEARWSAALLAFYLTFGVPAAVMALAPDLLMLAPMCGAVWLALRGDAFAGGVVAGLALLVHTKGVLALAAALLFHPRGAVRMIAGFAAPNLAALAVFPGYVDQVWIWGSRYAADSFVANPLVEGLRRTLNWAGFHTTLVAGAACYWWRERSSPARRLAVWTLLALVTVAAGWRFFPRYYFALLPPMILTASRGLSLLTPRRRAVALVLLLIPLARFGPRYLTLASGGDPQWSDIAMHRDSRAAAEIIRRHARPGDTLLVWGYRPDIYVLTRMPAGTPWLDSQPLTGVLADRHLTESRPTYPASAAVNRRALAQTRPGFIVDGLGVYNPRLSLAADGGLGEWLRGYQEVGRTQWSIVYRRLQ